MILALMLYIARHFENGVYPDILKITNVIVILQKFTGSNRHLSKESA
jgi:hypothetical protein